MAVGKIRAGQAGSLKKLKTTLKESVGSNGKYFERIKPDEEVTGRFLDEPYDFVYFDQHFNNGGTPPAFPCNSGDCEGCDEGYDVSRTWVAPFVDIENNKVMALQVPKGIVDQLTTLCDKRGTILDRDITISREGTGKEGTKYSMLADDRRRRDLSMFEPPDIMGMLQAQLEEVTGVAAVDDDDDDDEPPVRRTSLARGAKKATKAVRRRPVIEDDDDDDDDDEPPRRLAKKAPLKKAAAPVKKVRRMKPGY